MRMFPRSRPWRAKDTLLSRPYLNGQRVKTRSQVTNRSRLPRWPALLCYTESHVRHKCPLAVRLRRGQDRSPHNPRLRTPCTLKSEYSCHRNHLRGTLTVTVTDATLAVQAENWCSHSAFRGYEFFASTHILNPTGNNGTVRFYTRAEPTKRLVCRGNASSKVVSRLCGEGQLL